MAGMATVLLVEDDPAARQGLELALRRLGHGVRPAGTGEAALRDVREVPVDVVVLGVMLRGLGGFEVCRQLRRGGDVPIIMLTARGDDLDIVGGLEAGADDYVVKPVEPRVLDARIRAVLRRMPRAGSAAELHGHLMIDRASLIVQRDGGVISLTPTELRLLLVLSDSPRQVSRVSSFSMRCGTTITWETRGWSMPACSGFGRKSRPTFPSRCTSRQCAVSATVSDRYSVIEARRPSTPNKTEAISWTTVPAAL
jgi:DNA-binding response OmpR family regulator